jgi:hypothetical protein
MTAQVSVPRRREGQLVPKLVAIIGVAAAAALLYMAASLAASFIEWLFAGSSSASPISAAMKTLLWLRAVA